MYKQQDNSARGIEKMVNYLKNENQIISVKDEESEKTIKNITEMNKELELRIEKNEQKFMYYIPLVIILNYKGKRYKTMKERE